MSKEAVPPLPPTVSSLTRDLHTLGVTAGMTLLVHSSLKAVAEWVIGGAEAVILALEAALGRDGTLVMPTMTGNLTDPAEWQHPPVPPEWWEVIRQETPPFMPDLAVTRSMGIVPETFRKQNGVVRSNHPHVSFAAWGKHAAWITDNHRLLSGLGEESPLARIYDLDGHVLLIGVGHENNTSLHLAEERARYPGKRLVRNGAPIVVDGKRQWVEFEEQEGDSDDFDQIGSNFGRDQALIKEGNFGKANALLMPQRPLVDYAVQWMEQNRKS